MWSCTCRRILEIVMPDDQSRILLAHPDTRHSRVTIRVGEINISTHEDILIIRAPRRKDERAEYCDLQKRQNEMSKSQHAIDNRKTEDKNRNQLDGLPVVARRRIMTRSRVRLR